MNLLFSFFRVQIYNEDESGRFSKMLVPTELGGVTSQDDSNFAFQRFESRMDYRLFRNKDFDSFP
jgi:hypothetical protein